MSTTNTYTGSEEIPFEKLPTFAQQLSRLYPSPRETLAQRIDPRPSVRETLPVQGSYRPSIGAESLPATAPPILPDKEHLYQFLDGVDVNNRPWSGKAVNVTGRTRRFDSHEDPELLKFLALLKRNPNMSRDDIQEHLDNCTTQNCSTNTFLGLSKMGAKTEGNISPRSELRNLKNKSGGRIDLSDVLGMKNPDPELNSDPNTEIPRGTTLFFQNPGSLQQRANPFDHVVFAENAGKNSDRIYRSLNEGQERSELQTLQEVIDQGRYQGYNPVFSGKFRNFF